MNFGFSELCVFASLRESQFFRSLFCPKFQIILVSDYDRSKAFFTQALAPLGIAPVMEIQGSECFENLSMNGKSSMISKPLRSS
jgi:hypothetical protein